jgi:myosin heavy subunit
VTGFVEKNRDALADSLLEVARSSSLALIKVLLKPVIK